MAMAMAKLEITLKVETDNYERYLEYIGAGKMTVNFTIIWNKDSKFHDAMQHV